MDNSALKIIFHLYAQSQIFSGHYLIDQPTYRDHTVKNSEVSSARSLTLDSKPSGRSFIQAVFDIEIPIFSTLMWAYPNLIIGKVETTKKGNTRFDLLGHEKDIT